MRPDFSYWCLHLFLQFNPPWHANHLSFNTSFAEKILTVQSSEFCAMDITEASLTLKLIRTSDSEMWL